MATKARKMDMYSWEGTDRKGNRVKGNTQGLSINLVKAELRRQGVTPLKVRKKAAPLFSFSGRKKKITPKEVAIFSRQLATMITAGVPLVQAFEIISKGNENESMGELLSTIRMDIEGGASLSQALAKHPRYFDKLYCSLIHAGEQAGILENLLDKIATYKEKTEAIKGKIRKAMMYPVFIIVAAIIITTILLLYVVPQFEALFTSFGGDLPAPTKLVIAMSEFMQANWYFVFAAFGITIYGTYKLKQTSEPFNEFWDKTVLQLPIFGNLVRKATIARFSRTLATMFSAGVPLVEAMESVAGASGNRVYTAGILQARDEIATGQQLQTAIDQTKLFPNMVVQMIAIGEESGSLDKMLSKVADFFEREVDDAVDGLSSLMEPVIMVVLGGLIGGLVIAMYLPIFKMGQIM
jgi:type IV pilus assembly protein PilC